MSEKLSDLDQEHIADIVSGSGAPSVSSAKANLEPTFAETYPLTASYLSGVAKPAAGLAQWIGIHEPARYLHDVEKEAKSTGRTGVGAAGLAGELASLYLGGEMIPKSLSSDAVIEDYLTKTPIGGTLSTGAKAALKEQPLLTGALTGAATSAVMPTEFKEGESYEDFLKQKATDIAKGAGLGGAFGKGSQLIFAPIVGKQVQTLKDMGMTQFTPGQLLSDIPLIGPYLQKTEQQLSSVPVVGSIMQGGRQNAINDFNKAVSNHILDPMNNVLRKDLEKAIKAGDKDLINEIEQKMVKVNPSAQVGHEMVDDVYNKVSDAYQDIAPKIKFDAKFKPKNSNETALASLNNSLKEATEGLDETMTKNVKSAYTKSIIDSLDSKLTMSGEKFRKAESNLGNLAYSAYKSGNVALGKAYRSLQSDLRDMLAKQNPAQAEELQGIHDSFKRWLRLEDASAKRGAEEGIFSPAQFAGSVEKLGGKKAAARGKALMQDEARAAEAVLGKKVPDSGTAERLMTSALFTGGSLFGGVPIAPTLAALGAYTKPGMTALTKLATERPKLMRAFSPEVQTAAATAGGINANQYAKGGILVNFKKKSKKLAQGGVISLAEGGKPSLDDTLLSIDRAKENIAHTYETAKDLISNPTPYLNKFKQIPSIVNDPAEPISHYLKGDISGGLKSAGDYLSEKSPEELAMGFAQPGAMGIVGSIENAGVRFTSPLKNTVSSHKLESMPGSQWSSWLESNAPKAAKKEAEAVRLNDLLESNKNAKLTKSDIINHIESASPEVETKILGNKQDLNTNSKYATPEVLDLLSQHHGSAKNAAQIALANDYEAFTSLVKKYPRLVVEDNWEDKVVNDIMGKEYNPTKYDNWQLPGGENYKEMLVKLPPKVMPFDEYIQHVPESIRSPEAREHLNNIYNEYVQDPGSDFSSFQNYKSKHWEDPNIIAHLRMNDRITPEGKKMLHLEELQSDWGQQGKRAGFEGDEPYKTLPDDYTIVKSNVSGRDMYYVMDPEGNQITAQSMNRNSIINSAINHLNDTARGTTESSVPRAPYVTNTKDWTAMGFKQALKHAVDNGYEGITWTNGAQQADRYNLSKHLDSVYYNKTLKGLGAYDKDGEPVFVKTGIEPHQIEEYIGKEASKKLLESPAENPNVAGAEHHQMHWLRGTDLEVGGEGMKGYYDNILPQTVNDVMKQLGHNQKVQPIKLNRETYPDYNWTADSEGINTVEYNGRSHHFDNENLAKKFIDTNIKGNMEQPGIKITPELKESVLKNGIPSFKKGGLLSKFKKK